MGRHFVFRVEFVKFQARLCFCYAFYLLMSLKVLLYHCWMKTNAGWCFSGSGCLFLWELFFSVYSCFSCFVETDIFPSLHHIFVPLSSYQMAEKKIYCVSLHISTTPYPVSEGFQCITNKYTNRFMGIWAAKPMHCASRPGLFYFFIINCTCILFYIPKELPDVMCTVCMMGGMLISFTVQMHPLLTLLSQGTSGSHQMGDICDLLDVCPCFSSSYSEEEHTLKNVIHVMIAFCWI